MGIYDNDGIYYQNNIVGGGAQDLNELDDVDLDTNPLLSGALLHLESDGVWRNTVTTLNPNLTELKGPAGPGYDNVTVNSSTGRITFEGLKYSDDNAGINTDNVTLPTDIRGYGFSDSTIDADGVLTLKPGNSTEINSGSFELRVGKVVGEKGDAGFGFNNARILQNTTDALYTENGVYQDAGNAGDLQLYQKPDGNVVNRPDPSVYLPGTVPPRTFDQWVTVGAVRGSNELKELLDVDLDSNALLNGAVLQLNSDGIWRNSAGPLADDQYFLPIDESKSAVEYLNNVFNNTNNELIRLGPASYIIDEDIIVPTHVTIVFSPGAIFDIQTNVQITWKGGIQAGPNQHIFKGHILQSNFIADKMYPYRVAVHTELRDIVTNQVSNDFASANLIQRNVSQQGSTPTPYWFGAKGNFNPATNVTLDLLNIDPTALTNDECEELNDNDAMICALLFGLRTYIPAGSFLLRNGSINEKRSNTFIYGDGDASKIYQRHATTDYTGNGALLNVSGHNGGHGLKNCSVKDIWLDCNALFNENMVGVGGPQFGDGTGTIVSTSWVDIDVTGGNAGRHAATIQGSMPCSFVTIRLTCQNAVTELQRDNGNGGYSGIRYGCSIEGNGVYNVEDFHSNKIFLSCDQTQNGGLLQNCVNSLIDLKAKSIFTNPTSVLRSNGGVMCRIQNKARSTYPYIDRGGSGNTFRGHCTYIEGQMIVSDHLYSHDNIQVYAEQLSNQGDQEKIGAIRSSKSEFDIKFDESYRNGQLELFGSHNTVRFSGTANVNTGFALMDILQDSSKSPKCLANNNTIHGFFEGLLCQNGVILIRAGLGNRIQNCYMTRQNDKPGIRLYGGSYHLVTNNVIIGHGQKGVELGDNCTYCLISNNILVPAGGGPVNSSQPTGMTNWFAAGKTSIMANNINDTVNGDAGEMMKIGRTTFWMRYGRLRMKETSVDDPDDGVCVGNAMENMTVAQINASTFKKEGNIAYVRDASGGKTVAYYDGYDWRRISNDVVIT